MITAGNIRFRTAVMQAMNNYRQAEDRTEKPFIVHAIISNTYSNGGCFLRRCDSNRQGNHETTWIELSFLEQKDKVRHALRDAIAEMKTKHMKSVQCRHDQLKPKNGRASTNSGISGTTNTTTSNVDMNPIVSISSVLNQPHIPLETGIGNSVGGGDVVLPPSSSTTISALLDAFPNSQSAIVQHLLQHRNATPPHLSNLLNSPPGIEYFGSNGTANAIGIDEENRRLAAMQLAAQQLQLAQMNGHNNMNLSIALQIRGQQQLLQTEQQMIQNVQNSITRNATALAVQREYMQLHAYIARLKNAPPQQDFS